MTEGSNVKRVSQCQRVNRV